MSPLMSSQNMSFQISSRAVASRAVLGAALVTAGLAFSSAASASVLIDVDKSTQHMSVSVDGTPRYEFPVSTGRAGFDTPNGRFHPKWMSRMHYSNEYEDAPMPHSIFFTGGDAIHGFTGTPFGVAAVSHGCVRIPLGDAAELYQLVSQQGMPNTTIVVQGHAPRRSQVAQRGRYGQGYGRSAGYVDRYGAQPNSYRQRSMPRQPALYSRQQDNYGGNRGYYQQPMRPYGGY